MAFEPGNSYYCITAEEYDLIRNADPAIGDLLNDFLKGPDGNYWALPENVDEDEFDWLMENTACDWAEYTFSTQPGGKM